MEKTGKQRRRPQDKIVYQTPIILNNAEGVNPKTRSKKPQPSAIAAVGFEPPGITTSLCHCLGNLPESKLVLKFL